ncbi:MAG: hypothetical protein AAB588_05885 [Patescibacteria group bacterium]
MYKKETSFCDHSECIKSLVDTCTSIIGKHKYSDEDIRTITFANIRGIAYSSLGITNLLHSWVIGNEQIKQVIPQLLGMSEVTTRTVKLMGDDIAKTAKLSLILLCQFQIENLICLMANAIGATSKKKGFYDKVSSLIKSLELDSKKIEELNVPALIRNSLHSNGIHHSYDGKDFSITLQGVDYEFLNGKKVSCASMTHIAHSLENSLEILDEILDHEKLKNHTEEIHDEYRLQTK